jgi:hypothetical protein
MMSYKYIISSSSICCSTRLARVLHVPYVHEMSLVSYAQTVANLGTTQV